VTAALARESEKEQWSERAKTNDRILTMEGTSMAAPVVTGMVALLLQRRPTLKLPEVQQLLSNTAQRDSHTGYGVWSSEYGCGKLDIRGALDKL
jgi:subtilisin family serine protease